MKNTANFSSVGIDWPASFADNEFDNRCADWSHLQTHVEGSMRHWDGWVTVWIIKLSLPLPLSLSRFPSFSSWSSPTSPTSPSSSLFTAVLFLLFVFFFFLLLLLFFSLFLFRPNFFPLSLVCLFDRYTIHEYAEHILTRWDIQCVRYISWGYARAVTFRYPIFLSSFFVLLPPYRLHWSRSIVRSIRGRGKKNGQIWEFVRLTKRMVCRIIEFHSLSLSASNVRSKRLVSCCEFIQMKRSKEKKERNYCY